MKVIAAQKIIDKAINVMKSRKTFFHNNKLYCAVPIADMFDLWWELYDENLVEYGFTKDDHKKKALDNLTSETLNKMFPLLDLSGSPQERVLL